MNFIKCKIPNQILILMFPICLFGQNNANDLDSFINEVYKQDEFQGTVLIEHNGDVILNKGYGYANRDWNISNSSNTKYKIGSITKLFTSITILQLAEKGLLNVNDPISKYVKYIPQEWNNSVTIHHLLTHTSGIPDYLRAIEADSNNAINNKRLTYDNEELINLVSNLPLNFVPGTECSYSNTGYILLGVIVEELTFKPWYSVVQEQILDPIGMNNTGFNMDAAITTNRATGYNKTDSNEYKNAEYIDVSLFGAAGGLYSTAEDLLKFEDALEIYKILSKEYSDLMFKSHYTWSGGSGQGYGWEIIKEPVKFIGHMGDANGFMCLFAREVNENDTVIILSNVHETNLKQIFMGLYKILYNN
jgi:CubicO group peptidase (beta-lactamase class C family)